MYSLSGGVLGGQERALDPWRQRNRQLWAALCWCWKGNLVLCSSRTCFYYWATHPFSPIYSILIVTIFVVVQFLKKILSCLVWRCVCHSIFMEVREQPAGVDSLLPPWEALGDWTQDSGLKDKCLSGWTILLFPLFNSYCVVHAIQKFHSSKRFPAQETESQKAKVHIP